MVNIKNINISHVNAPIAIGKDITININQNYNELHQHLKALSEAIQNSGLIEEDKKDSLAEIITIDTQLSKRAPNKDIIRESWNALEKIVMANDLWDLIEKIKPMIVSLLGS